MDKDQKIMVGWRISRIRDKHNKTLEEFGKLIDGATKSNVSKWEKGEVLPNRKRLKMIADYEGIHVNELLYGDLDSFASQIFIDEYEKFFNQNKDKEKGIELLRLLKLEESSESFKKWIADNVEAISFDDSETLKQKSREIMRLNIESHKKNNPETPKSVITKTFKKIHNAQLDLKEYFFYGEEDSEGNVKLVSRDGMPKELYDALDSILTTSRNQIYFLLSVFDLEEK